MRYCNGLPDEKYARKNILSLFTEVQMEEADGGGSISLSFLQPT